MKRVLRSWVSLGIIALAMLLFFVGRRMLLGHMHQPSRVLFSFDSFCSKQFKTDVRTYTKQLDDTIMQDPTRYAQKLQKQFPLIATIMQQRQPSRAMRVYITCAQPLCRVNDDKVLIAAKNCVSSYLYQQPIVEQLPQLIVVADYALSWKSDSLYALFNNLSPELFAQYSVTLERFPDLLFIDKEQHDFSIRARLPISANQILASGDAIRKILTERSVFLEKKQRSWIADMRFEKQIVLVAK